MLCVPGFNAVIKVFQNTFSCLAIPASRAVPLLTCRYSPVSSYTLYVFHLCCQGNGTCTSHPNAGFLHSVELYLYCLALFQHSDSPSGKEKESDIVFYFTTSDSLLQVSSHKVSTTNARAITRRRNIEGGILDSVYARRRECDRMEAS